MTIELPVTPCPKPRMTRRDKWQNPPRPRVARYRAFCDAARAHMRSAYPLAGASVTFHVPMPKSWSKKKRASMDGQPHQQKPDLSNLLKALEDALEPNDEAVHHYASLEKVWSTEGRIIIVTKEART